MGRFIDITGAPIVSDFQEMPLDFMAKALESKQLAYDKDMLAADEYSKLIPKGYEATSKLYEPLTKQVLPELENLTKRALLEPEKVGRELVKWKTNLEKNPAYQALKADEENKKLVLENWRKAKEKGEALPLWRLEKTPLSYEKVMSGEETFSPEYYDIQQFEDPGKYVDDQLDDIKSVVSSYSGESIRDLVQGEDGGLYGITSSGKRTSNLLNDRTPVAGTGKTIGQLVQDRLNSVTTNLLTDRNTAANYFRKAVQHGYMSNFGASNIVEAADKFVQNRFKRFEDIQTENKTGYTQRISAVNRKELERIPIPGQNPYSADGDGFTEYVTDVYNTKMASAQGVVQKLIKSGALKGDMVTIMNQIASNANPQQLQNILDNVNTKLDVLRKNMASGKEYDKNDFMYQTELKNDLTTLVDAMESEAKIKDRVLNTISTTKEQLLKTVKNDGSFMDNIMVDALKDIDAIYKFTGAEKDSNITKLLYKYPFIADAFSKNISNSVVPNYSVRTGLGNDTGIIKGVQDAITKSWSQNNSIFEGQSKNLKPNEWLKDQLSATDKDDVNVVDAAVDKNGKWIVTFKATNGNVKSFVYKDQGELNYHKNQLIQDLRKTKDPNAQDFAGSLMFKDMLASNNQQAKWLSLASAQPTENKPVTVNLNFSGLSTPLPISKVMNPKTGGVYYTIGNQIATDLDDVASKIGKLIQ